MKTKVISALLILLIGISMLTSCSGNSAQNKTASTNQEQSNVKQPKVGTRQNPLPLNITALFDGSKTMFDKYKVEITLVDFIRGDVAWEMANKANQFNSKPEEGKEYLFAKFKIKALESENDRKIDINNSCFELVSQDGVKYEKFVSVSGLKPQLTEMYNGAEQEGYASFEVNKSDANPMIVFLERNNSGIWFTTDKTKALDPNIEVYTPTDTKSDSKSDDKNNTGTRKNPVLRNTSKLFDGSNSMFDKYKVELTLNEIIRGDTAWNMAYKANQFNSKPEEGKEYLFAKFKIKALESENDSKIDINNSCFELVSQDGVKYEDFVSLSGLKPQLTEMYNGAEQEGYVCFMVNKADINPMIVFLERNNSGIWFSTTQ